jgi:hypothetical protein
MVYTTHSIKAFLDSLEDIFEDGCAFWRQRNGPTSQIHRELTQPKWLPPFPISYSFLSSLHVAGKGVAYCRQSLSNGAKEPLNFSYSIKCVRPRLAFICIKLTVHGLKHTPAAINVSTSIFKKRKFK